MPKKLAYFVFLLLSVLIILEVLLRVSGRYLLHNERHGGEFMVDYNRSFSNNHRYTHPPSSLNVHITSEFSFPCESNNLGYREKEIDELYPSGQKVMFVGDSFIDGLGADCFKSMPHQFGYLDSEDSLVVINAGISGSDVFYAYGLLNADLPRILPKTVLLGVNQSDIYDYVARGGFERFLPEGVSTHRKAPINLYLYRILHLYRFYLHDIRKLTHYSFLSEKEQADREAEAVIKIIDALRRTDSLVTAYGSQFIVFFYPLPAAISNRTREHGLETIYSACRSNGVQCLLLTEAFEHLADSLGEGFSELYWPFDGHYNEAGYGEFAKILKRDLGKAYPDWRQWLAPIVVNQEETAIP